MKVKELAMLMVVGLLMSPYAYSATPNDVQKNTVQQNAVRLNDIKELPLYEVGPKPISLREMDIYIQHFVGVAHHVFVQRTPRSLTLGARMRW